MLLRMARSTKSSTEDQKVIKESTSDICVGKVTRATKCAETADVTRCQQMQCPTCHVKLTWIIHSQSVLNNFH